MKYFSLFSGIGGFEYGIEQAYKSRIQVSKSSREKCNILRQRNNENPTKRDIGIFCIGFSEIDKYAIQIYKKYFPNHKEYGDVTNIKCSDVPDFDLLCGGFPCQSFSIAGKRGGFDDIRGTLFFEIARIAQEKQPRFLLLENVKGLLSHDKGRTFGTILNTLDELGYDLQWQVLNSKNFGVPQNRERVFIIGHLRTTPQPQVFPLLYSDNNSIPRNSETKKQFANTITRKYGTGNARGTHITTRRITNGKLDDRTLESKTRFQENGNMSSMQRKEKNGVSSQERRLARPSTGEHSRGVSQLSQQNTSSQGEMQDLRQTNERSGILRQTLPEIQKVGQPKNVQEEPAYSNYRIRRLTPLEAERLQGFPDGWTTGISDTQRYKCLGNAVTTNVISAIMEKLLDSLRRIC